MKKILVCILILVIILPFTLIACKKDKTEPEPQTKDLVNAGLQSDSEFGGIFIKATIDEFNAMGYEYGDSVNVVFSNGYELLDLPYYNGYYVDAGVKLLVGYPGYPYIKAAINYGDDLWIIANIQEDTTATITLNTKGKYKGIQDACDIHYFDERSKYTTNEEFANFRNISVGNIKSDVLYRSASPCDNKHNRAHYVDDLIEAAGVQYILNLADTKEKIDGYIAKDDFNSPYFLSLYNSQKFYLTLINDNVAALAMNMNYRSDDFKTKLVNGFKAMANSEGPYLVHCLEGKDRTGFVCIVIEALMGATYQEIVDDYMLTYDNYYGIKVGDEKYNIIKVRNVDAMLRFIIGDENADLTTATFVTGAENYMLTGGMNNDELALFKSRFAND